MRQKKPFKPTARCPHPWCRKLHLLHSCIGLLVLSAILFSNLAYVLFVVLLTTIGYFATKAVRGGKSDFEIAMQDEADQLSGRERVVRPGWAMAAVVWDLLLVFVGSLFTVDYFQNRAEFTVPAGTGADLVSLVVTVAFITFGPYAHWKATQPVKPKRVTAAVPNAA